MTRQDSINRLRRELAYRESDGIEVSLLWNESSGGVFVVVRDRHRDEMFELEVAPPHALDAFEHPYAHAAARGVVGISMERDLSLTGSSETPQLL